MIVTHELTIREVTPADFEEVRSLSSGISFLPRRTWKLDAPRMIVDGLSRGVWTGLGSWLDDRLVAYIDFKDIGPRVEIGFMMTHPEHQGQGLQRRVLSHAMAAAGNRGLDLAAGHTALSNAGARRVFESASFAATELWPDDRVDGSATVRYEKSLAGGAPF